MGLRQSGWQGQPSDKLTHRSIGNLAGAKRPILVAYASFFMEPNLTIDPSLAGILEELKRREPIFHREEFGRTRADFERMTSTDFWEIGASGRRYSRLSILDELEKRYASEYAEQWDASEFYCRRLSPDVFILTYTLLQGSRKTRRTTLWQKQDAEWKILFHQGTVVQEPDLG